MWRRSGDDVNNREGNVDEQYSDIVTDSGFQRLLLAQVI